MIIGLSIGTFTTLHVIISLLAIASGLVVLAAMLSSNRATGWTAFFLLTTVLTTVTGFMFPITAFTPALGTGIVSAVLLAVALLALYGKKLTLRWRWIYVVTAIAALYINVFVLIVQAFQKISFLSALAPTESEPPFLIAQAATLVIFIVLGAVAAIRFRPLPMMAA